MGESVDFGRSFGTVRRVAFQPFRRGESKSGTTVEGDTPRPPATYKSFLKKAHTEPVVAEPVVVSGTKIKTVWRPSFNKPSFSKPSFRKPNFNNAGKWIDQRFDFLPKPPPAARQSSSIPTIPMTDPPTSLPTDPPASPAIDPVPRPKYRIWTRNNTTTGPWLTAPRPPKIPLKLKRRGTTMSKAVIRGWDRVVIVSSSFSTAVTSKIPRKQVTPTTWVNPEAEMSVRQVEGRMSLEDSIEEEFHSDEEIVEAETVTGEMVLEHLPVESLEGGKEGME
jgi:hypothetical protein